MRLGGKFLPVPNSMFQCSYFPILYFHISLFSIFIFVQIAAGENSSSYSWQQRTLRHLGLKCCNREEKHKTLAKSLQFFWQWVDIRGIFVLSLCAIYSGYKLNVQWLPINANNGFQITNLTILSIVSFW